MGPNRIVVIGGALVDVRATTGARWIPDRSLPGSARLTAGGAARNVAVDLAHLGHPVTLLTVTGDDPFGEWLVRRTSACGVDVAHVLSRPQATGLFVTVGPEGGETWSIAGAGPAEAVVPSDLEPWRAAITGAAVVASDANFLEPVQEALAALAASVPRVLLATSPHKAARLRTVLAGAAVLVCNRAEALALTGLPDTLGWQALGTALLLEGVDRVVMTHGPGGIAVLTADDALIVPAPEVTVVDSTGAGDAVAAIAVHALLAGLSSADTAALAAAAAAVVVQSDETTPPALAAVIRS